MKYPAYLELLHTGELKQRAERAGAMLGHCDLCPRNCGADRLLGKSGAVCGTGRQAEVSTAFAHFGEERVLVGQGGSGTIFFTGCSLGCVFCQNYTISHGHDGHALTDEQLADAMLYLQARGVHNINLVTPSHVVPQILAAVSIAAGRGLRLPLVYNTSAYEKVETLRLLDGVVDIYMPDFKVWDPELAARWLRARDYPVFARAAIREMFRQVGVLRVEEGIARRGLLVRHLVMPGNLGDSRRIFEFLAELSPDTYVSIMDQYMPMGRAMMFPELARRTTADEISQAFDLARSAGLHRFDRSESACK